MNKKKLLALLMALVMTLSLVPVTALATELNADNAVAEVLDGETHLTFHNSLKDAITAAESGQTVKLLQNITYDANHSVDVWEKAVSLNLNGHTLTTNSAVGKDLSDGGYTAAAICYSIPSTSAGNVTISNGTIITAYGAGVYADNPGLTLTLENLNINAGRDGTQKTSEYTSAVRITGGAKVTINSGSYSSGANALSVSSSGGEFVVNGGTFNGNTFFNIDTYDGVTKKITINGGTFTSNFVNTSNGSLVIKGGTFNNDPSTFVPAGFEAVKNGNGTWTVVSANTAVAQIGNVKYETLESAVADANDGDTIELLQNASGAGLFVGPNKFAANGLTIDFGDHTYTVTSPVGSTGTENQALHFEQGNVITLKNGTINMTTDSNQLESFEMVMQNYGSLTIDDMIINGTGIAVATYSGSYGAPWGGSNKPQFNYNTAGNSVIRNSTITVVGDLSVDDNANVTFEDDAIIYANKIATHGTDARYNSVNPTITVENGAKFSFDPTAVLASNQKAVLTDGLYVVTAKTPVARIGSTEYTSFVGAVAYANNHGDCTITILDDIDFSQGEYAGYEWAGSTYHPIEITGNDVVLDLNGHTFSNMGNCALVFGHIHAADGQIANGTIQNGTLNAGKTNGVTNSYVLGIAGVNGMTIKNITTNGGINVFTGSKNVVIDSCNVNGTKYYAVCAQTGSNVTIENSTITKNTDSSVATKAMFWVDKAGTDSDCVTASNTTGAYDASAITIKSGSCTVDSTNGGVFYLTSGIKPVVKGGTFNIDPSNYVATGYKAVNNNNGTWTVELNDEIDYTNPTVQWRVYGGVTHAVFTYTSPAGTSERIRVKADVTESYGVRTYTAQDHGHTVTKVETVFYRVGASGAVSGGGESLRWGEVCTLTAAEAKDWFIVKDNNEIQVASCTMSYTFAVTEDVEVITRQSEDVVQQPIVAAEITSTESGKAEFHARWTVPSGCTIKSVTIYRGYTSSNVTVEREKLIQYGTPFVADLNVLNGDYLLKMNNLSTGSYQHAVIVIKYSDGTTYTDTTPLELISETQSVQVN